MFYFSRVPNVDYNARGKRKFIQQREEAQQQITKKQKAEQQTAEELPLLNLLRERLFVAPTVDYLTVALLKGVIDSINSSQKMLNKSGSRDCIIQRLCSFFGI